MKSLANSLRAAALVAFSPLAVFAVNEPVIVQAESGSLPDPTIFTTTTAIVGGESVTFVNVTGNFPAGVTTTPGTASRVLSYTVTFPAPGTYNLYARYRIGPGGANDDSFYYGNGFGVKDPNNGNDWITTNNLNGVGYSAVQNVVLAAGTGTGFKWLNLSAFTNGGEGPLQFTVPAGALTQTFQIGSRENGLDIDKFAFGPVGVYYTVANLNGGEAGSIIPPPPPYTPPATQLPMATGKAKYLGNAYSPAQAPFFERYWNQVTPENAGKWASVEATRDVMNWTQLDAAYNFAKANGFKFRSHVLVWGNQQPAWIKTLPPAEQLEEIEEWFAAVAARYPDIYAIDVVNEPLHDPPTNQAGADSGNYIGALGGANDTDGTGWDWVLNAFRLARLHFPPSVKLVLNDYSITNDGNATTTYLQIIEILKAEDLIDMIGVQGHAFSTTGSMTTHKNNLDRLAATGLPLTVTELDIDGLADQTQLDSYKRIFPTFWEHPAVEGITLWGWRPGHWRTAQGAYLVNDNGSERAALKWLMAYVANTPPVVTPGQNLSVSESVMNGAVVGTVVATDVDAGTVLQGWQITGGTGAVLFAINAASGQVTVVNGATFDFESATGSYTLNVTVNDGYTNSAAGTVTINLSNANDNTPVITPPPVFALDGGTGHVLGTLEATDADDTNEPGFTLFVNWEISGGDGAAVFAVNGGTGQLSIADASAIDFDRSSYRVLVTVSDGINTSEPQEVTVTIPDKVLINHKGKNLLSVSKHSVPAHLAHGDSIGAP